MPVELIVPSVGESITEVEIGDWLKKQGETVDQDEPVVVIETDKVSVELPAPATGTITKLLKQTGDKANGGGVVGGINPSAAGRGLGEGRKTPAAIPQAVPDPTPAPVTIAREEQIVVMTPIRKRIAERLVEAKNTAALLTTFNQVDMSAVKELRSRSQETFQSKYGIKLGLTSFFVKASVEALKLVPQINAEIRGS